MKENRFCCAVDFCERHASNETGYPDFEVTWATLERLVVVASWSPPYRVRTYSYQSYFDCSFIAPSLGTSISPWFSVYRLDVWLPESPLNVSRPGNYFPLDPRSFQKVLKSNLRLFAAPSFPLLVHSRPLFTFLRRNSIWRSIDRGNELTGEQEQNESTTPLSNDRTKNVSTKWEKRRCYEEDVEMYWKECSRSRTQQVLCTFWLPHYNDMDYAFTADYYSTNCLFSFHSKEWLFVQKVEF